MSKIYQIQYIITLDLNVKFVCSSLILFNLIYETTSFILTALPLLLIASVQSEQH